MEPEQITTRLKEILARFEALDHFLAQNEVDLSAKRIEVENASAEKKDEMAKSLDDYLQEHVSLVAERLKQLKDEMSIGYEDVLGRALASAEVTGYAPPVTLSECVSLLYRQIDEVNKCITLCNDFNFNVADPQTKYEMTVSAEGHENEAFVSRRTDASGRIVETKFSYNSPLMQKPSDHKPARNVLLPVFVAATRAEKTCEAIAWLYRRGFDLDRFGNYVNQKAREWLSDEEELQQSAFNEFKRRQILQEDDVVNEGFFQGLAQEAECGKVQLSGSDEFNKYITLGDMYLSVFDKNENPSYGKYTEESPILSRYMKDGNIAVPVVLNLKRKGNVMINLRQSQNYGAMTQNLIHSVVQAFLLSFPAGRLNLSVIELNKSCNFSQYTPLKKFFFGPIVRDGVDSDSEIHRLKNAMYDIHDNKISYNKVPDFYAYNEKSKTNPQSAHLLIITDFPSEMSEKAMSEVLDIMENGNHTGVFTLLVNNFNARRNVSEEAYSQFVKKAEENALVFRVENDFKDESGACAGTVCVCAGGQQDVPFKNTFVPVVGLGSNMAAEVADRIVLSSENVKQQVIKLKEIWDKYEENLLRRKTILPDASALLELPIGMRGGEVQTLKLSTTGDGSAHAVIIGGTGSGKSNLLHTIVLSGCYRYSPDELQVYLVDFKGGVEFKYYEANKVVENQLPHVRLTGLTSEPEDGLAILKNVRTHLRERENLFRKNGVEDIMQYNKKNAQKLPRLLIMIDEVQELFRGTERNNLTQSAIDIMGELFKKGRAFGINLLWASQNVPRVSGIKDEIISQIGNRICLKVNNTDDAEEIGIDAALVRGLNRPEKGLAVVSDASTSGSSVEFRVAYAESTENRGALSSAINKKWANTVEKWHSREPLFIVGNDETPIPNKGVTTYTKPITAASIVHKSTAAYNLELGQDFITGKPFFVPIELMGTKSNLWMAGASNDELRDMIGYALLSTVIENTTNADLRSKPPAVYYVNCERKALGNENDLYYTLPTCFPNLILDVSGKVTFVEALRKLYLLNKSRGKDTLGECTPVFLFMHKAQIYEDLFADSARIPLDTEYTGAPTERAGFDFGSTFGADFNSGGDGGLTVAELFREVAEKGADNGIHMVITVDKPSTLNRYNLGLRQFVSYALIKGISEGDMLDITGSARGETLNKEGVAFCFHKNELCKFKPYRFNPSVDGEWLNSLIARVKSVL